MIEKRIQVNEVTLQVQERAQSGAAIIFLHFSGANLLMWPRVTPYFQDRYHLVLVDLRGHGKSDRPETGYHMDDMAADIVEMMQQLDLEQAHIIGSSMGAEVGLSLAANYPDKVLSLVCDGALSSEFGPYGTWDGTEAAYEEYVADRLAKMRNRPETVFPSAEALVENRREIFEQIGWWNEYVAAMERYGVVEVADGQYTKAFGKQAMLDYMSHYFQYRLEDYYRKVKCPLLMLPGEDELESEREKNIMKGLSQLAEQGEIVEVAGWQHPYGWLLDPDNMCQTILTFLSGVDP